MRRIHKGNCPNILTTHAPEELEHLENNLAREIDLNFDSNIYANAEVKESLKISHNRKCAYCERHLNGDFGDVEHFRPKGGYVDERTQRIEKPGYWWLAYDWSNLLLSCSECNRSCKKNNFPLMDESQRNVLQRDVSSEQPLLINPGEEDPSDHIEFNRWIALPKIIDGAEDIKGAKTIEVMKLNTRPDLVKKREIRWKQVIEASDRGIDVSSWIDDDQEFTGMFQTQINWQCTKV